MSKSHIVELKSLANPPSDVKFVLEAVAILMGKADLSWKEIKKMISDRNFLQMLEYYDKDNVCGELIKKIQPYVTSENFTYDYIKSKSCAAASVCNWVIAINNYHYLKNNNQ